MPDNSNFAGSTSSPTASLSMPPYGVLAFPESRDSETSSHHVSVADNATDQENSTAIDGSLAKIERRERQLWVMLGTLSLLLMIGMVLLVLPQLMEISTVQPDKWYLPRLFLGLVALMALLNIHLSRQRHTLKGTREALLQEREHRQIAEAAAVVDPLTQSFNRRYMDRVMDKEISRAEGQGTQIAFLMIDVDDFKSVNTRYGHIVGDTILREVADVIRRSVRASDTVIRYGGDEFLVILTDAVALDAERVISRVDHRVMAWNQNCHIEGYRMRLSCGWAMHTPGAQVSASLQAADKKMYDSKQLRSMAASAGAEA